MKGNELLHKLIEIGKTLKWPQLFQRRAVWAGLALTVILVCGVFLFTGGKADLAMLVVDGEPLVVVAGSSQVDTAINKIKDEYSQEGTVVKELQTQLTYDKSLINADAKPVTDEEIYKLLKDKLQWQVECWTINIDGKPTLHLASESDAQKVLEDLKQYYLPKGDGQVSVEEVAFVEDVQVTSGQGSNKDLLTPEAALQAMIQGMDKIVQYAVKSGDSLWSIARENNITVAELRDANPELNGDYLKPGMQLNLVKAEPLVRVTTTVTTTVEEKIPYGTIYENDSELWRGQQRVKQPGTFGAREVTYRITKENNSEVKRETLVEKILLEPVSQVVIRGTKTMVASRGDGGNGILAWPIRGKINSPYGAKRGRSIHTGTDIDGDKGDPVFSAGDGVVLEAGWKGNYGNCIIIDHGNGLTTLYGHLSKINVSMGQTVKRGDLIGAVGSTGKSTGPHLHFEVRINGNHQNPMRFLEQ